MWNKKKYKNKKTSILIIRLYQSRCHYTFLLPISNTMVHIKRVSILMVSKKKITVIIELNEPQIKINLLCFGAE